MTAPMKRILGWLGLGALLLAYGFWLTWCAAAIPEPR